MKFADNWLALTPDTVIAAVERIVAACEPDGILVFGSRAKGCARVDSDLDLVVLLRAPVGDSITLRRRLSALLADLPLSKDLLVIDQACFAECRQQVNSVYHDVAEEGLPLWHNGRLDASTIAEVCRYLPESE